MTPDIYTILKIGIATGNDVLEGIRLKTERTCRFFLLARVFFIDLTMKVKMFFAYCNGP